MTQSLQAFSLSSSWRRVCLRSSTPPPPHTSVHLTIMSKRQHGCSSRKPHSTGSGRVLATHCLRAARPVAGPTIASLGHPGSASQDDDSDDMDFSAHRKGRLSGPQLQAHLSRLTDRTRLRRLKETLLSGSAWQHVTRIEDLCHAQVSHRWLFHLNPCAGSVSLFFRSHVACVSKPRQNKNERYTFQNK